MNPIEAIQFHAATAKNDRRVVRSIPIGRGVRQGDIYIWRVEDDHPRGSLLASNQLAVGESTGSRHMAEGAECYEGVKVPEWVDNSIPLGPVVVAKTTWKNTHIEHADYELPEGTYQVCHQLDVRTMRRVQD